jgi:hypothetical protein
MFKMFLTTVTFFGWLTASAVHAQSSTPMQARIPFAFTVQKTVLAAGNYRLTYSSTGHFLAIRGLDRQRSGVFVGGVPTGMADGPGKLRFDCEGKTCSLAQVSQGAAAGGGSWQIRPVRQERRVALLTRVISRTIPTQ